MYPLKVFVWESLFLLYFSRTVSLDIELKDLSECRVDWRLQENKHKPQKTNSWFKEVIYSKMRLLLSEDAGQGSANRGHGSNQALSLDLCDCELIMVLTFWKVVEEERGAEATGTVCGPQSLRNLKSRRCFPTPDVRHLAGSRSSTNFGRGIHEQISYWKHCKVIGVKKHFCLHP